MNPLFAINPPAQFFRACVRYGLLPTRSIVAVNVARQTFSLFARIPDSAPTGWAVTGPATPRRYGFVGSVPCSTSRFGIGQAKGSNRTPLGLHRVVEKIGGGWPVGTVFKSRRAVGFTWNGLPYATITSRILWLEGLEPGLNRGGNVDSYTRYIYIHGTGDEPSLGRPASCGCIHLAADHLMPLFDQLPTGTLVWIEP